MKNISYLLLLVILFVLSIAVLLVAGVGSIKEDTLPERSISEEAKELDTTEVELADEVSLGDDDSIDKDDLDISLIKERKTVDGSESSRIYTDEELGSDAEGSIKIHTWKDAPATEEPENGELLEDNGLPYAIKINKQQCVLTVYSLDSDGYYTVPVRTMLCSVSKGTNTPLGIYKSNVMYDGFHALVGNVYGQYSYRIVGNILFHTVPYSKMDKSQVQTWEYNLLGTQASHGCIRLCTADCRWIYENCEQGTIINIFNSDYDGPLGRPNRPYVFEDTENEDWDPTDMDEKNPYTGCPAIYGAYDKTINAGDIYDPRAGVLAFSSDREEKTDELMIETDLDTHKAGVYDVTYSIWDKGEKYSQGITVTVLDNTEPMILSSPEKITLDEYYIVRDGDWLRKIIGCNVTIYDDGVKRTFSQDQIVDEGRAEIETVKDSNDDGLEAGEDSLRPDYKVIVDISKVSEEPGQYEAEFTVVDAGGNKSVEKTVPIIIK